MIAAVLHVLLGTGFISMATVQGFDSHSSISQTNAVGPIFQGRNDTNTTDAIVAQMDEQNSAACGWIGVQVRPMTAPFAASLGMAVPYGAIFDQPEAGSPAGKAGIEAGDVITAINGLPLMRSSDFARMLAANAPGTSVYLSTWRSGMFIRIRLTLGSSKCRDERQEAREHRKRYRFSIAHRGQGDFQCPCVICMPNSGMLNPPVTSQIRPCSCVPSRQIVAGASGVAIIRWTSIAIQTCDGVRTGGSSGRRDTLSLNGDPPKLKHWKLPWPIRSA